MPTTLTPVSLRFTAEEYFAWEETQEEKHDFIDGEVFTMSGASRIHNDIVGNLYIALRLAFRGTECSVFAGDMRVEVEPGGRYVYPDLAAACGALSFLTPSETTFLNPALIVEVLSPSTEAYDRGEKLATYRAMPSVREIVLVRQDRRGAEAFCRGDDGKWSIEDLTDGTLALACVGVEISVDDVYEGTGL
ncbi:Uma2 family endonuclease [Rubrivirga sp. IMCC45206]|uniref:Uma2 family endonuclease n=1 Tax=Rubrivirga sp. IMCC45206 TaxID=3391614 RepID=UPI0039900ADA